MNPTTVEELCNIGFSPNGCPSFGELKNAIDLMACGLNALSGSEPDTDLTWTYAPQDPNDQDNNNTLATQIDKDGNPTGQTYVLNNSFAITDFDQDTDADGITTTTITHTPAGGGDPTVVNITSDVSPDLTETCNNDGNVLQYGDSKVEFSKIALRDIVTMGSTYNLPSCSCRGTRLIVEGGDGDYELEQGTISGDFRGEYRSLPFNEIRNGTSNNDTIRPYETREYVCDGASWVQINCVTNNRNGSTYREQQDGYYDIWTSHIFVDNETPESILLPFAVLNTTALNVSVNDVETSSHTIGGGLSNLSGNWNFVHTLQADTPTSVAVGARYISDVLPAGSAGFVRVQITNALRA